MEEWEEDKPITAGHNKDSKDSSKEHAVFGWDEADILI